MRKILHSKNILLHSVPSYKKYRMITATTYKRFLLICGMLCVLLTVFAEEIVIGSWNIQGNGHFEEQEIIQFASYFVADKHIDILALQEVKLELLITENLYATLLNNNFLERLTKALPGGEWKFISSAEYAIRHDSGKYGHCKVGLDNAIVYRSDKVYVEDLSANMQFNFKNFYKSNYKMNKNNTNILRFSSINSQFSDLNYFYLINTHLPAKSRKKGWLPWMQDIKILKSLYKSIDSNAPIVWCGDFNAEYDDPDLKNNFSDCLIGCCKPTTVGAVEYKNNYDHFILNSAAKSFIIQRPDRYTSDAADGRISYGYKFTTIKYFFDHISDHVPIFMSIDIRNF